ncbi:helix-turn-helix domain-containing protein [Streptacidiphilus sp. N1-3]|uniref:Helix-turn-helix domain-containing protein n=1 Tax=Streptacidiphilus alkalitolerans TaxID=3342712 RepID=A0ABV6XBC3_9ACTN
MTTPKPTPAAARGPRWSPVRQRQALDLSSRYRNGATVRELAKDAGLSPATVLNRLRSVDTPMRTQQQAHALRHGTDRTQRAQRLRTDYEAGASVTSLAERHRLSVRTVRRMLREAGTVMRTSAQTRTMQHHGGQALQQEQMDRLRARYEAGAQVPALAAENHCSTSTVYRLLRRAGTTMRARGRSTQNQVSKANRPAETEALRPRPATFLTESQS